MFNGSSHESVKLFCSIQPSSDMVEAMISYQARLKAESACSQCRLVPAQMLHCTLVFIGAVQKMIIPSLVQVFETITMKSFEVVTTSVVILRPAAQRSVYCLGLEAPCLMQLREAIIQQLDVLGVRMRNDHSYLPHITFARCSNRCEISPKLFAAPGLTCTVTSWDLMQSTVTSQGSIYKRVHEFPLLP